MTYPRTGRQRDDTPPPLLPLRSPRRLRLHPAQPRHRDTLHPTRVRLPVTRTRRTKTPQHLPLLHTKRRLMTRKSSLHHHVPPKRWNIQAGFVPLGLRGTHMGNTNVELSRRAMGSDWVPCPDCGQPKSAPAKRCMDCYKASLKWSAVCRVDDCEIPARYKESQLCAKHYDRWLKYGDPNIVKKAYRQPSTCVIDDCQKKPDSHGICPMHLTRFKKHGNYDTVLGPPIGLKSSQVIKCAAYAARNFRNPTSTVTHPDHQGFPLGAKRAKPSAAANGRERTAKGHTPTGTTIGHLGKSWLTEPLRPRSSPKFVIQHVSPAGHATE